MRSVAAKHKATLVLLTGFITPYKGTLCAAAIGLVVTALVTLAIGQGVRLVINERLYRRFASAAQPSGGRYLAVDAADFGGHLRPFLPGLLIG